MHQRFGERDLIGLASQMVFSLARPVSGFAYEELRKHDHYVIQDPLITLSQSFGSRFEEGPFSRRSPPVAAVFKTGRSPRVFLS